MRRSRATRTGFRRQPADPNPTLDGDVGASGSEALRPIGAREFDGLMRAVGPFEPRPVVAIAVSGGADSMALAVLVGAWARRRGGTAVGLTVDHRLRPESGEEARQVTSWLRRYGMDHHVPRWDGPRPGSAIEAAAREARYALLNGWCRRQGVLHLVLAHHREDQAETFLMRLARGSGPTGLAAMPAITETAHGRILRPLLSLSRGRLRRTLEHRGQAWIEDPSNQDVAFTRVKIRRSMPQLASAGLLPDAIRATTEKMAELRGGIEAATASLLAEAAEIYPTGHARIMTDPFRRAPRAIALPALAAMVTCIGGRAYGPRTERLDRLYEAIRAEARPRGRTLSGCLVVPRKDHLLVTREPEAISETIPLTNGTDAMWDGRFRVRVGRSSHVPPGLSVGQLGEDGWARLVREDPALGKTPPPPAVRAALPAVRDGRGVVFAPNFPSVRLTGRTLPVVEVRFCPANPLSKSMFSVV